MPLYEYQCQSCGSHREVMQRMSDPPLETCEDCGGALKKLISAPAFQFKGDGWYVTDYARKDQGKAQAGKGADGEKGKGAETKASETKSSDAKSSGGEGSSSTKGAEKSAA